MALLAQKGIKLEKQVSNFRHYNHTQCTTSSGTMLHAEPAVLMLVSHVLNGANGAPLRVIKIQETLQNMTYSIETKAI